LLFEQTILKRARADSPLWLLGLEQAEMNSSRGTLATIVKSGILKTRVKPRPCPSMFVFPGLSSAQPVWQASEHPALQKIANQLRNAHPAILKEYLGLRAKKGQSDYKEDAKLHTGEWQWNSYILKGDRQSEFASHCPQTAETLESFRNPTLMADTPFSFAFFSTMGGKATIAPHNGPCNLRLRCHFPLLVPQASQDYGMEVGGQVVIWKAGEPVFFDDAYEHRVWNNTGEERVVLLFDLWHPELTEAEIDAVRDMFSHAREQGWIK